jgi:hypothetical protein
MNPTIGKERDMEWITERAVLKCGHDGRVANLPSQRWVRVSHSPVLVDSDPQGRPIAACPNYGLTIKPCSTTLPVITGYSSWLRIGGQRVAMSNLDGLTDGTVPGTVHYTVRDPGQAYVRSDR